jgi:hypothetical protein
MAAWIPRAASWLLRVIGRRNLIYLALTILYAGVVLKFASAPVQPGATDWTMLCIEVWAGSSLIFGLANLVLLVLAIVYLFRRRSAPAGARVLPCLLGCSLPVLLMLSLT